MTAQPAPTRQLVDIPGAALYLGCTVRFVRRLIAERRVTHIKLGKLVRFDLADLDTYISTGVVPAGDVAVGK